MRRGPISFIFRLAFIAALLGAWEWAVVFFKTPAYIVPAPSNIAYAMYNGVASNLYVSHIGATVSETLLGFMLGCALAFMLGIVVALSRSVEY
jgi:NitT/TauT family transport system permease protein